MSRTIILLVFCCLPLVVFAASVPGLYEAQVPVLNQEQGYRDAAVKSAMRIVLVKLTGDRNAASRTALSPLILDAEKYLLQYRYIETPPAQTESGDNVDTLQLWVRFDETALNAALRDLGIPVWGKERPSILVWLAVEDATGRHLVSLEEKPDYVDVLERKAKSRGIILVFPLLDLEDTSKLRASDVWGGFQRPILDASRRYHADTVLVGRVESPVPDIWEGQWTAYTGDTINSWSAEGDLPDAVLDEGIDGVVDMLASVFTESLTPAETAGVELEIDNVTTVAEYARVLKYLNALSSVTDVQVEKAAAGRMVFSLTAHGGEVAVKQAIALGRTLEPMDSGGKNIYRLLP